VPLFFLVWRGLASIANPVTVTAKLKSVPGLEKYFNTGADGPEVKPVVLWVKDGARTLRN
jgi:hypothetical protein